MAYFHTNEGKTQPSEVDFLKDEREKDATRIGGLSERKTQPKWRTLTPEKKDTTKVGGLSEGKTQPKWRTFK